MENIKSHKKEIFWYNMDASHKRSYMFFDIGSQKLQRISGRFCNVWRTFGPEHSLAGQNPGNAVSLKPLRVRGVAETHPTPATCTQQRIGFRGKAANFTQRKTEYDGASRDIHAARPLFLFFVKVLSGTCHETGFRGCAAFLFRAVAVASIRAGAGKEQDA